MEFDVILKERRSIRSYAKKKVSFQDVLAVCEAARYTPMAGNLYTIRLIIVSDKEKKAKLMEAALDQEFVAQAPYVIVVCSDLALIKRSYGKRGIEIYARQQAGAAIQNMLLKITDLGLASCWVGAFDEKTVKDVLKIPEKIRVEALLPIGHAKEKVRARIKPELKQILSFEEYGVKAVKERRGNPIVKK